jgi:hypothetical protein
MFSILSFDSALIKELLDTKNSKYYDESVTLIFKMKLSSKDKNIAWSAIDTALEYN